MIEAGFLLLALGLLCLLALPLILAGALLVGLLKLVLAVVLLPFQAVAWGMAGLLKGVFFITKALGIILMGGVLLVLGITLLAVPMLSLAPLLLLAGLCWLAWRIARGPVRAPAGS